jgi:protein SCO1/2
MNRGPSTLLLVLLLAVVLLSVAAHSQQRYTVTGLVLSVDRPRKTMVVSCQAIQGFMDAMVMPFTVPEAKSLDGINRGVLIDFILIVNKEASHAENIHVRNYAGIEREPAKARRLQGLDEDLRGPVHRLSVGESVPDFVLTDQKNRPVRLSQFAGKVVALNFVYTRCVLPEYCFRSSNNFGILQKRYPERLGRDLILLSVTFDPVHDQPSILQNYAQTWKADPENWRFLTGAAADVQRLCDLFGVTSVPADGLYIHSLHTAIIGRDGKLVANLEGNEFTGQQFADLVKTVLAQAKK